MPNYLFSNVDWHSVQEHQKTRMTEEIAKLDGNRLLNTSIEDLITYLEQKFRVDVPVLREDEIVADQKEVNIDVSKDPLRFIRDRTRPFYITGTKVEITIPFDGDSEVFKIQPTRYTLNPPYGSIRNDCLILEFEGVDLKVEELKNSLDRVLTQIKEHLDTLSKDASSLNGQLPGIARDAIERRRAKLLQDQNLVASLGFPLRERPDSPRTYIATEIRRKITPSLPNASSQPFKPEPTLSLDDYEHILSVIQNMAEVMERSPSAFASMDEEALRSHFLVQLNGHYEGEATGETFNYEGKTDILVRVQGKNIFIAECKYWKGPKVLTDTIDQLLSYSSWRDTKLAVIIFNRNKNFTAVLDAILPTVESHENFKKFLGRQRETNFRYLFSHRDDKNREMILTILAFDVPS